jgi:hypothetical protein
MIKDRNTIVTIGLLSLVFAILLGRYFEPAPVISFLEGLLYGLSIVMNIYSLILYRKLSQH